MLVKLLGRSDLLNAHKSQLTLLLSCIVAIVMGCRPTMAEETAADRRVQFNRDIRPILSDTCFACHGPDEDSREASLRMDLRELALQPADSGELPIVPHQPDKSEVVRRVFAEDESERMPPPEAHKPLLPAERELLRRWIAQGAEYASHWAYTDLRRPRVPQAAGLSSEAGAIDQFIAARLATERVHPTPEADRVTLIRRLSFDLTGLPPTLAEVEAFVNDNSHDAYGKLVNRLLDSPRYGERMAIYWLDLVRYADTVGYHGDQNVSQWPLRDYVINAFNENMPYDRFVREQLAGDLLPDTTLDQQVASGYNRLNQTTEEGGAQDKEYRAIYFADRVRNASQVFMGATMGCAQCHDHKFDPYTARDFYSFGAFFADLDELGKYNGRSRPPEIRVPNAAQRQQLAELDQRLAELRTDVARLRDQLLASQPQWEADARNRMDETREVEAVWIDDQQETGGDSSGTWDFIAARQGPVHRGSKSRRQTSDTLVQHFFLGAKTTVTVTPETRFYAWVYLDPQNPPKAIMLQLNDGSWEHRKLWGSDDIPYGRKAESWKAYRRSGGLPAAGQWVRLEVDPAEVGLLPGSVVGGMAFTQFGGLAFWDQAGWITTHGLPAAVAEGLVISSHNRTESQRQVVRDYYLKSAEPMIVLKQTIADVEAERKGIESACATTVVAKAVEPRTIRILKRGNWMDDSGEIVEPAIPAFLGNLDTGNRRATRLDLANWLCEPNNPLTARTMVNRMWHLMFGRGICTSVDDLGGQGTFPSYPDLLDWLAVEFVESGWDIKHLFRTIVTSATYRQSSTPPPRLRAEDPYNNLFARQGRFRIDAEMVRDSVLATSGLLVERIGGRSTTPYQPAGYYDQLNFPKRTYVAEQGDNQYRRGVYTHWQRTFLHPMLKAFDAPSREECTAARSRSNTPLQALTLLNDPTFVEAARVFAERIVGEGGPTVEDRIAWAYRSVVSRRPEASIAAELRRIYDQHLVHYRNHVSAAKQLIAEGNAPVATEIDPAELAAWTSVARVLFNLHETNTRY